MNFAIVILLSMFSTVVYASNDSILEKIDAVRANSESFFMRIVITDYSESGKVDRAEYDSYFSGYEKSVLICRSGKNKKMKILMKDNDMWACLPGSRRSIRITPQQRLMGQASNGDVAKIAFSREYTISESIAQGNNLVLTLIAKKASATYQRIALTVSAETYVMKHADFFLLSGKLFKKAEYEYDYSGEFPRLAMVKIIDTVKTGRWTTMTYGFAQPREIADRIFNATYLPEWNG